MKRKIQLKDLKPAKLVHLDDGGELNQPANEIPDKELEIAQPNEFEEVLVGKDVDLPEVDPELPNVEHELEMDLELPNVEHDPELPKVDLPNVEHDPELPNVEHDPELPKVDLPNVELDPELPNVDLPNVELDPELPNVELDPELPKVEHELEMDPELPKVDAAEDKIKEEPEILPSWTEISFKRYCKKANEDEIYPRDSDNNEMYITTPDGQMYAHKRMLVNGKEYLCEYPITLKNGDTPFAENAKGQFSYPVNLEGGAVIYPKDPITGKEIYLKQKDGSFIYPTTQYGLIQYAKDADGNEYLMDLPTESGDLLPTYGIDVYSTEIYPKTASGDEYYRRVDNVEMGAKDEEGEFYYAKKAVGDEFYPKMYLEEK